MKRQAGLDANACARLEATYPGWKVWRTQLDGVPAYWAATRRDPAVGVDATVMTQTAEELEVALTDQLKRAQRGEKPGWAI
jgi:hypothetical protein